MASSFLLDGASPFSDGQSLQTGRNSRVWTDSWEQHERWIVLNASYEERGVVKEKGAKWDPTLRKWKVTEKVFNGDKQFWIPYQHPSRVFKRGAETEKSFTTPLHPFSYILTQDFDSLHQLRTGAQHQTGAYFEQGAICENIALISLLSSGWQVVQASEHVDHKDHIDLFIEHPVHGKLAVDVKAQRSQASVPTEIFLELIGNSGLTGWVFGNADAFLFEVKDEFVAVDRDILADYAMLVLQTHGKYIPKSEAPEPNLTNMPFLDSKYPRIFFSDSDTRPFEESRPDRARELESQLLLPSDSQVVMEHQTLSPTESIVHLTADVVYKILPVRMSHSTCGDVGAERAGNICRPGSQRATLLTKVSLATCPILFRIPKIQPPQYEKPIYECQE